MLSKFQFLWESHLEQTSMAKHRIEHTGKNILPIHSAPYKAGPPAREFKEEELNRLLMQKAIKPAQTEWAALIVFAPTKKRDLYVFR